MARNMEKEYTTIEAELSTMDNGIKIENMVLALLFILITKDMKETG